MNDHLTKTLTTAQSALVGQRIKSVRWVSPAEAAQYGWGERPIEIELENGVLIVPSRDPEGNAPGALFLNVEGCEAIVPLR